MKTCAWIMDDESECGERCEGNTPFCGSHNRTLRREESEKAKASSKRAAALERQKEKRLIIKADTANLTYKLARTQKAIRKVSKKREELNKEYFKLVEQFKKDNPLCKANVNEYCTKKTDDPHHPRGRGEYLMDVATWIPVCRSCHIWIGNNHKEAEAKGLVFSRLSKNKETI